MIKKTWRYYLELNSNILCLVTAEFFLQVVNGAFTLALNLHLAKKGYTDSQIASFTADRFMAVMLFALPFGYYIKGRALRPIFALSASLLPVVSLLLLETIGTNTDGLLRLCLVAWGICFTGMAIPAIPYILRNSAANIHTRAISLNAAMWSLGLIVAGSLLYLLAHIAPSFFDEKRLLQFFSIFGVGGAYFVWRMSPDEVIQTTSSVRGKQFGNWFGEYDWLLIFRAVIPTTLIAIGAGLTIPFMNLFFYNIFGLDTDSFSLLGSFTALLVTASTLAVPYIKNRLGYKAIPLSQGLAIASLVALGASDFLRAESWALPLALFCFAIRQPFMSLANPMTSELTMYYVGKKNQEMMSALSSSIWSGSWFISSQVFAWLRYEQLRYGSIFFITAAFYVIGVMLYVLLIKEYQANAVAGKYALGTEPK